MSKKLAIVCLLLVIGVSILLVTWGARRKGVNKVESLDENAEILFLSNGGTGSRRKEVYSMDGSGGDVRRITYTELHHFLVGIDNSGRFLVVTRAVYDTKPPKGLGDEDRKSIWIIDLESGSNIRLTDLKNSAEGHSFSPDGIWIVFYMIISGDSQSDIYKIRRDGTGLTKLTDTNTSEFDPEWSHDGEKIAFTSYSLKDGRFMLKVMSKDGSNVKTIYDGSGSVPTDFFPAGVYDPSWSPDDRWIVFEMPVESGGENGGAGVWHIFKIRSDGTGLVDLSANGGHGEIAEYLPSFSPSGDKILFSARYTTSSGSVDVDVFLMNSDGTGIVKLTLTPSIDDMAVWIRGATCRTL